MSQLIDTAIRDESGNFVGLRSLLHNVAPPAAFATVVMASYALMKVVIWVSLLEKKTVARNRQGILLDWNVPIILL